MLRAQKRDELRFPPIQWTGTAIKKEPSRLRIGLPPAGLQPPPPKPSSPQILRRRIGGPPTASAPVGEGAQLTDEGVLVLLRQVVDRRARKRVGGLAVLDFQLVGVLALKLRRAPLLLRVNVARELRNSVTASATSFLRILAALARKPAPRIRGCDRLVSAGPPRRP